MKKARLRALTQAIDILLLRCIFGRNEESPTEGIDTFHPTCGHPKERSVEMKKARLRALTHI